MSANAKTKILKLDSYTCGFFFDLNILNCCLNCQSLLIISINSSEGCHVKSGMTVKGRAMFLSFLLNLPMSLLKPIANLTFCILFCLFVFWKFLMGMFWLMLHFNYYQGEMIHIEKVKQHCSLFQYKNKWLYTWCWSLLVVLCECCNQGQKAKVFPGAVLIHDNL